MAYQFTQGECKLSETYDLILNKMLATGWQNITSNYVTDGDVMYSEGIEGNKKIFIRLFPYWFGGIISAVNDQAYNIRTKGAWTIGVQLQKEYTPGASGSAGTFSTPERRVNGMKIVANTTAVALPLDLVVRYYLYVDKSKVILFTKAPDNHQKTYIMNYFGLPDTLYAKCENGRGAVFASTAHEVNIEAAGKYVLMSEFPDEGMGIADTPKTHYYANVDYYAPPISPNRNGKYFLTEFFVHQAQYGLIAKLDGILGTISTGILSGDTIALEDGTKYLLLDCGVPGGYLTLGGSYSNTIENQVGLTGIAIEVR